MHLSTKKYGHAEGLSACFRQWRATHSHCSLLHGYALAFEFTFAAELDNKNWVQDFGGLKGLKERLKQTFDHKLVVAADDPMLDELCQLSGLGLADVIVLEHVGCERFAQLAHEMVVEELTKIGAASRVQCVRVQCWEHEGNSAIFVPDHHTRHPFKADISQPGA